MSIADIKIGNRSIGLEQPAYIIAEGCDNHLGNMDAAKEMVRQSKASGADAIKFQHHLPDEEMLREGVPMSDNFNMPLFEFLEKYALTLDQHIELKAYCEELGIQYMCTPFSRKAAEEINGIGVDVFKIGSGELTDIPTLKVIASFGKPMILSTGMCVWEEIQETLDALLPINKEIVLMNCTSAYPTAHKDVHLGLIAQIRDRFKVIVGHSDHTPDIYTCIAAIPMGAKLLEKHIILDKRQPGPDQSVSIDPRDLYEMVQAVRRVEDALGGEKHIRDDEKPIRTWAHRSVVSLCDIPADTVIEEAMVWTKRPGTGIPAKHLEEVVGKKTVKAIPKDSLIAWEDLGK